MGFLERLRAEVSSPYSHFSNAIQFPIKPMEHPWTGNPVLALVVLLTLPPLPSTSSSANDRASRGEKANHYSISVCSLIFSSWPCYFSPSGASIGDSITSPFPPNKLLTCLPQRPSTSFILVVYPLFLPPAQLLSSPHDNNPPSTVPLTQTPTKRLAPPWPLPPICDVRHPLNTLIPTTFLTSSFPFL